MYFEDLKRDMKVTPDPVLIDKQKMINFALQYDNVPIHTDEEYAKNSRFGQLLAPGVMTFLEVWAKYLEKDLFGEQLVAGMSTKIEWSSPVFADDMLHSEAVITDLISKSSRNGIAVLEIKAYNRDNVHVMTAEVKAVVKKRKER